MSWVGFTTLLMIGLVAFLNNLHSLLTIEYETLKSIVHLLPK